MQMFQQSATGPYDRPPVPAGEPTDTPAPRPEQMPGQGSPAVQDPPTNPDTPGLPTPDAPSNPDTPGMPSPIPGGPSPMPAM